MDHDESSELPRDCASSSEPYPPRPKPFDDSETSSRKRQRTSRGGSRSRSVETSGSNTNSSTPFHQHKATTNDQPSDPPRTPDCCAIEPNLPESTSSRVTLNLRASRHFESSPLTPQHLTSPSKMANDDGRDSARISVETESDALSTAPAIATPSSSPSRTGPESPAVELVTMTDIDDDIALQNPPLSIIGGGEDIVDLRSFPYNGADESLAETVRRLQRFFNYEPIETSETFVQLHEWIDNFLSATEDHPESWSLCFITNHEFWLELPRLVWSLSWRTKYFGQFLQKSRQGRAALSAFLSQFSRLAGRFLAMDVKTLSMRKSSRHVQTPELGSYLYLLAYSHLLRKTPGHHIGNNLEQYYNWDWDTDVETFSVNFRSEGGTIANLIRIAETSRDMLSNEPKVWIEYMVESCKIISWSVEDSCNSRVAPEDRDFVKAQVMEGFKCFQIASAGLDTILEKHITFLVPETAKAFLDCLPRLLTLALRLDLTACSEQIGVTQIVRPGLSPSSYPKLIGTEWKFRILEKLITSAQMQLRVVGVTCMCSDLVELYANSKGPDASSSPLLLCFAEFILQHKLIDYIVGSGSHPEIISESTNILGFLIVTKTHQHLQSDMIWRAVRISQDPRVVDAILRMVSECFRFYEAPALLHICKKVNELPTQAFTLPMREFCHSLFMALRQKSPSEKPACLDAPPYELCARLIRESSVITSELPSGYPDIQSFAAHHLQELLAFGPQLSTRNDIYLACITDISKRTLTAPGSICVINTMLCHNMASDLKTLTRMHGLTQLVVEELESNIADERHSVESPVPTPASEARRELLLAIILHEPSTISPEIGTRLWNHLVGSQSKSISNRETAWQILNRAAKATPTKNVFIATCFREYLPHLPPDCFTTGALDFAHEAVDAWLADLGDDISTKDLILESPAIAQLWRMILTAPINTIDDKAIKILVDVHVYSDMIVSLPRADARILHLALVDRCLRKLADAAAKLKALKDDEGEGKGESVVIVPLGQEKMEQERIFTRSLAVLREFLKAYQSNAHFATPKLRAPMPATSSSVQGEPLTVKYQSFDSEIQTDVKLLTIGTKNNTASLLASLQRATGFEHYKVFYRGKEFDPDHDQLSRSLEDLNLNGLFLIRRRTDAEVYMSSNGRSAVQMEITKHMPKLWDYLAMHDTVAQEIYYFLIKFPIYDALVNELKNEAVPHTTIFPPGKPFKSLYALYTLREYVREESQKASINEAALGRSISLVAAAISDPDVLDHPANGDMKNYLGVHLTECLVQCLKGPCLPDSVASMLNTKLLQRLLQLLEDTMQSPSMQHSMRFIWCMFEAILESSLHSRNFWVSARTHLESSGVLQGLILDDHRVALRKTISKQISVKCTYNPGPTQVSALDFILAFWPLILELIPETVNKPNQSEETYGLALSIFKKIAEASFESLDLEKLIRGWSDILLSYDYREEVGQIELVDTVVQGLANLVYTAMSLAKASAQQISCSNIGPSLFVKYLFPPCQRIKSSSTPTTMVPLLNTSTRHTIYEIVYHIVKDDPSKYQKVLSLLHSIVPYDADNGLTNPYAYDLTTNFDRTRSIRSSTGYVGLRNLGSTCYLNSLLTHLFMNAGFREFMLGANIADENSQRLLLETQQLFAYMQNSYKRYIDPSNLIDSIRTYDNTAIDVSLQMDVDEFYNLLFDRWECQMSGAENNRRFRSFFGGQLIQQIKSKECEHISTRLEPFSAIQCDVKGKTTLQESLQAYVDGEMMEGNNKYKCETCDRHVDAVKRTCLKDIPDNVILHLKRFAYSVKTSIRSKINDYFDFPLKIDMRPYTLEYLEPTADEISEDMFELVGVLVHSGTAESGHYYSFIRERPSNAAKESWVQFNDDNVAPWNLSLLEESCFGGLDFRTGIDGDIQYDKNYSAYMLFYERSSVAAAQRKEFQEMRLSNPVKFPVNDELAAHIVEENEILMRRYCLYDPHHPIFVKKMLGNVKQINKGRCSETHTLEKLNLTVALSHLDQVVARTNELPDFSDFMNSIKSECTDCAECCRDFLEWFCECPETLRHLLLRNAEANVRVEIASSVLKALAKVKLDAPYAYGLEDPHSIDKEDDAPDILPRLVKAIDHLWDQFHSSCRAWPEYFGLLEGIATLGGHEPAVLLDSAYLRKVLDIILADRALEPNTQIQRLLSIAEKRGPTRPINYGAVIGLLFSLLQYVDLSVPSVRERVCRLDLALKHGGSEPIGLTQRERETLTQHWVRGERHILTEKLLHLNQNEVVTHGIIMLLLHNSSLELDRYIFKAITYGIKKSLSSAPSGMPSGPFLRAALVYCEHSETRDGIFQMVVHVSKVASRLESAEGKEFLKFFIDVVNIDSNHNDIMKGDILVVLAKQVHLFAPALLVYDDPIVRQGCEDLIREMILAQGPDADIEASYRLGNNREAVVEAVRDLGIECLGLLKERYLVDNHQAVRSVLANILHIIDACAPFYMDTVDDKCATFDSLRNIVMPPLRKIMVDEAEELVSDWEASDAEYGSSESVGGGPMDSDDVQ